MKTISFLNETILCKWGLILMLDLENDHVNKTGYNLKTTCSISILWKDSDSE